MAAGLRVGLRPAVQRAFVAASVAVLSAGGFLYGAVRGGLRARIVSRAILPPARAMRAGRVQCPRAPWGSRVPFALRHSGGVMPAVAAWRRFGSG